MDIEHMRELPVPLRLGNLHINVGICFGSCGQLTLLLGYLFGDRVEVSLCKVDLFVHERVCRCLEYPLSLEAYDLQVITPAGIAVSTKDAYSGIRPHLPEVPLREALARPAEEWDGILLNDFEETVFAKYPELAAIKRSLYDSGAVYASMSGSGSALFAIYRK